LEVVLELLNNGADANIAEYQFARTPLHEAGIHDHAHLYHVLLSRGADPDLLDCKNKSAQDYLTTNRYIATGQDINRADNKKKHPLVIPSIGSDNFSPEPFELDYMLRSLNLDPSAEANRETRQMVDELQEETPTIPLQSEFQELLKSLNIHRFSEALAGFGIDCVGDLAFVSQSDLTALGIPIVKARRLLSSAPG